MKEILKIVDEGIEKIKKANINMFDEELIDYLILKADLKFKLNQPSES